MNSASENGLHLDFAQEEAALKILPTAISSNKLGRQKITIKHFQTPAWEIEEHSHPHHELLIHLNSETSIERNIDCHLKYENMTNGDIVIIPAGASHRSLWQNKNEFMVLSLPTELIKWSAWESFDPEQVELLPQFAQSDPLIYSLVLNLKAESEFEDNCNRLYVEALTSTLCTHLLWKYTNLPPRHNYKCRVSEDKLKQAIEYINDNLDRQLKLSQIATQINISQDYFSRLFKQSMNISPHQYIIQQRLKLAMQLLDRGKSIAQTAYLCGFSNQSHLYKAFRSHFGITPKAYQIQNR